MNGCYNYGKEKGYANRFNEEKRLIEFRCVAKVKAKSMTFDSKYSSMYD